MLSPLLFVGAVVLVGCATTTLEGISPDDTPDPNVPVSSDDPALPSATPNALEGDLVEGLAVVENLDILILESFPVQVSVLLDLQVGDACTQIGTITAVREDMTFTITVPTVRPADAVCAEEVTHFQEAVSLEVAGLEAGEYTVNANGVEGTFSLESDNVLPEDVEVPDNNGGGPMTVGLAGIESVTVRVEDGRVTADIRGWLADACTEMGEIREERVDDRITLTVETLRPANLMCAQVITEFETSYVLVSMLEAGEYTLEVNESTSTTFTIQ